MINLRFKNGALGVIQNSRRSAYGYDVRTEVFGAKGKLVMDAKPKTPLTQYGSSGIGAGKLEQDHFHFFMDRFREAYKLELEAFFACLASGAQTAPGATDALESLRLGVAATISLREKRTVKIADVLK
jgi:myo-inositol 2-dehydrogenase / D-chiro-inositol 1-dehydrogenase